MKHVLVLFLLLTTISSCTKDKSFISLQSFVDENSELQRDFLIACAGGTTTEFMGNSETPISVFFYNVDGADTPRLYQLVDENADPTDFKKYALIEHYEQEQLFNGRMGRFLLPVVEEKSRFIVAYKTSTHLHISDPIIVFPETIPTQDITSSIVVTEQGTTPSFDWNTDTTVGNVIYYSLVSDTADNFISGIYTIEKQWQFYDLSNVVLNVTPTTNPTLMPGATYQYVHMGVDEDNWVRSFGMKNFTTN